MSTISNTSANNATAIAEAQRKQQEAENERNTVKVTPEGGRESTSTTTNPKAKLDGNAFMKLLLTELKYQDPTQPMDSEKMLTQTSQLATLETQESTNQLMKELATQLKTQSSSGANAYAISSIGKLASIGSVDLAVTQKTTATTFEVYFPEEVESGELAIQDKNGNLIRKIDLEEGIKGVKSFKWDLNDDKGARVDNDVYSVVATYSGKDGKMHTAKPGVYPIEAVKFVDGVAQVKIGSKYIPITDVKEFSQG